MIEAELHDLSDDADYAASQQQVTISFQFEFDDAMNLIIYSFRNFDFVEI